MSDTLDALEKALKPPGMRRIPLPLESYLHQSMPLSQKRLVNLMAEQAPSDARTQAALISTPGLDTQDAIGPVGPGPIHALNSDMPGWLYVVSGDHAYRFTTFLQDLGSVGVPDPEYAFLPITIACGVTAVVIVVPPRAYIANHLEGSTLEEITSASTDGAFTGATSVAHLDGYFVFADASMTTKWVVSRLLDPSSIDSLDFASMDSAPNVLRRIIAHRGELWLLGEAGAEVWYDSGDANFPFRKRAGSVIRPGPASVRSVAMADQSLFFVGADNIVYRTKNYAPERISTHAIESIIEHGPGHTSNYGFTYAITGHICYCVTIADTRTLVYDCATQLWHERSSSDDNSKRWRPSCSATQGTIPILGDSLTNKLFNPVYGLGTEDGASVIRQMIMPPLWGGTRRAFCSRLEVEMETGGPASPGNVVLDWSDDGGHTFGNTRTMTDGANVGDYRHRVFTTRLGSFRQRMFRITAHTAADNAGVTMYAVDCDISAGAH